MTDTKNINLPKLIKRLQLINSLIALEEDEELGTHIAKLQQETTSPALENIITLLKQKKYGKAIKAIDEFLSVNNQLTFYKDPEIEALRFEAKGLEKRIQELSNEKAELDKLIHEFGVRHNHELGELILKILQFRKWQYKDTPQQEETEKDYKEFYNDYQTSKDEKVAILSDAEQKEIKDNYRNASKLCHPDLVVEAQKEMAHKIFVEHNEAYEKNNLQRVNEILESLQLGKAFTSKADIANEHLALQTELERLHQHIQDLSNAIATIKSSKPFEEIISIKDWDEYFTKTKQQLQEQLNQLENGTQ